MQVILKVGRPTADKGMTLSLVTQEMNDTDKLTLLGYHNTFGHCVFSPNPIQEKDIPREPAKKEGKTPGERLRGLLFLLHKEAGGSDEKFYEYYTVEMEKIINHFKNKIGGSF